VNTIDGGARERPVRPPRYPRNDRPLIFFLALGLVLAIGAGTQYVAWRFWSSPLCGVS
jgi:hypothetical protein